MADKYETRGRWVVGTDGSLRSEKAIMWAARHLSERNEPVPLPTPQSSRWESCLTSRLLSLFCQECCIPVFHLDVIAHLSDLGIPVVKQIIAVKE